MTMPEPPPHVEPAEPPPPAPRRRWPWVLLALGVVFGPFVAVVLLASSFPHYPGQELVRELPVLGNVDRLFSASATCNLPAGTPSTPPQRPHRDVITSFAQQKP